MLLIKGYYLVFLVFVHALVYVCELANWLRHPRRNLMVVMQRNGRPTLHSFLQMDGKYAKDSSAAWRTRPVPAYVK